MAKSTHEQRQINRCMENAACALIDVADRLTREQPEHIDDFKNDYSIAKRHLQTIADNACRLDINVNSLI